jgi:NAD(P)-dependent dehydrogenase (short-subunit alcohol dehydrogenase family)
VSTRQRVAVVTGGGGGIGGAIAEDLGRSGWFVVTVDPLVTLEGTEELPEPETTTAGRIVAAGGSARASSASVTDGDALRALFAELADEFGGLDAVVNVAGITRQSYFARGTEEDWQALLAVHLGGYLNVLDAALPLMAAAGHGRIVGVTSGSGWRAADAGGYSCAKRAVAALTWQLGSQAPPGVTVNALSPIANTRMVAAALERARAEGRAGGGGGLTLDSMPGPEQLGPLGAHLVADSFGWCSGQVVFASGPEAAIVDRPRLMEVVRTTGAASLRALLEAFVPRALAKAEANQASAAAAIRASPASSTSRRPTRSPPRRRSPASSSTDVPGSPGHWSRRWRLAPSSATASNRCAASHKRRTHCVPWSTAWGPSMPSCSPSRATRPRRRVVGHRSSPTTGGSSTSCTPMPPGLARPPIMRSPPIVPYAW